MMRRRHRRIGHVGRVGFSILFAACAGRPETQVIPSEINTIAAPIQPGRPAGGLRDVLFQRVQQLDSGTVAVAFVDLETGRRIGITEQEPMHAASTMKVPVLIELFRQAESGRFSLGDSLIVRNEFTSIADQSKYSLSAADDSDSTLYRRLGGKATLRELARLMIARSSNLATNLLIEKVTPAAIGSMLYANHVMMNVQRGVEDGPAFRKGLNNVTSADGLAAALELVARCKVTSQAGCTEMLEILSAQEFNSMIPAGLPAGTRVAHKTGWITGIRHDGAIVFPPNQLPYILVVLTRGLPDTLSAERVAADISREVWQAVTAPGWMTRPRGTTNAQEIDALYRKHRNTAIGERRFDQAQLERALAPHLTSITREEIGKSAEGQPLFLLKHGHGPTRVLLWSQMHGNESTATMALTDLVRFIAQAPDDPHVQRWRDQLTVLMIPMLNPDGARRFQRQNTFGIDVNRDARALVTPEGQALKAVHDRYQPQFGFNLHDQSARTRVGNTDRLAAIALLAPPKDGSNRDDAQMETAKRVAVVVRDAVEPYVAGYVTRYDDTFNPRAFGDNLQRWGTATVLIESGGWLEDPEKQHLRAANFAALVSALDAIADKSYERAPLARYAELPGNGRSVNDLLIQGGFIVPPEGPSYRADILADEQQNTSSEIGLRIVDVGDLQGMDARDTIDVSGLYLHASGDALLRHQRSLPYLGIGMEPRFTVMRSADPGSETIGTIRDGRLLVAPRSDQVAGPPHPAAGCYRVQLEPFPDQPPLPRGYGPPERVQLLWKRGTESGERAEYQIRPMLGVRASEHKSTYWRPVAQDSVHATWSTGLFGLNMKLTRSGPNLLGTAATFSDIMQPNRKYPEARVELVRIPCN